MRIYLLFICLISAASLVAQKKSPVPEKEGIRFFVDPAINSDDPEKRMAYGLGITPPWKDGGYFFVNLPEHLWYMPDTKGIARHHDKRKNAWKISKDGREAGYDVGSVLEPGVQLKVKAVAAKDRVYFEMTLVNNTSADLKSISPLYCFQYHHLKGFSPRLSDNFSHTYIVMDGKPVALKDITVDTPQAVARMAQVGSCAVESNWWAEKMGGMISQRLDVAVTALTALNDDRKVLLSWSPGKSILSNAYIPCIHADPCIGDLARGESKTVRGTLLFTRNTLESAISEITYGAKSITSRSDLKHEK